MSTDVVVIGAGANGLTAATVLARAGRRVTLLERTDGPGGQGAMVEFAPGFRAAPLAFDPGWLPDRVAGALGLAGLERMTSGVPLSVVTGDGAFLTLPRDARAAADAIRPHSEADARAWPGFTARLHRLAGFLSALYARETPDVSVASLADVLPMLELGRRFRSLGRTDMIEFLRTLPMSVWELLDDSFASTPLKAAVAAGGIQDMQQGPRSGGTGYVLLHQLVGAPDGSVRGRMPWRAGPDAFTEAAVAAARRAGVTFRSGAAVAAIAVRDETVSGVTLTGGEVIPASAVVSTADPARTLLDWVDPVWLDPEFRHAVTNIRARGCTAYVAYALDALPAFRGLAPEALGGIVSLTGTVVALERAADAAKYGRVSERPHVEIAVPSLLWPALAPAGRHVLLARVQYAPYRLAEGATWDATRRDALAATVTAAIEAVSPGFASRILSHTAWSPRDLEERFGLREGAASQGELGLDQILFMRPVAGWARHATPIAGLHLGGAGTHPGPGVLGGAGWLAARSVLRARAHQRSTA